MNNIYPGIPAPFARMGVSFGVLLTLMVFTFTAHAQQGGQGNTTIFGGAEMSLFSNYNFTSGGGGIQPGVVLTERAAGNFGILNFIGANLSTTGASDAGYVDGYVRKYGTGQFIFPVGDNGFIGQFAANADGIMGAYFHTDPNSATTSNLFTGIDYPALPNGGPFPTSSMGDNVDVVSTIEYWDIDGANASPLTLTWDATSAIGTLTGNELNKLTIVGWNGEEWVAIPSKVDVTSVLGGSSDFSAGSITTTSPLVPNNFIAYTFGSLEVPLPVTLIEFTARAENNVPLLTWATTFEINSDRFEIEQSLNARDWNKIGIVASNGESTVLRRYTYTDNSPVITEGEIFYRLKIVDNDGSFTYSRIRSVTFDRNGIDMSVYPNPSTDKVNIRDYKTVNQIIVRDMNGRVVYQSRSFARGDGSVDVKSFTPGLYLVHITRMNGTSSVQKVLVNQ